MRSVLAIHGGAGALSRQDMTEREEREFRRVLFLSLREGIKALKEGKSARCAVEKSICILEDESCFNAGRGSVLSHNEQVEMEASFMEGAQLQAGAVCGLKTVQNPIKLAHKVLESPRYVFLNGQGAEEFAKKHHLAFKDPSYFITPLRLAQLKQAKAKDWVVLDHGIPSQESQEEKSQKTRQERQKQQNRYGTVGAAALDQKGNLAAGTSTGGMTNKQWGRIGDAPLIGCGTFADNQVVAVSTTGHGEYFIRTAAAHAVYGRMRWGKESLQSATYNVIFEQINALGGKGGLIALSPQGEIAMPYNSFGMFRGWVDDSLTLHTQIWNEEPQLETLI